MATLYGPGHRIMNELQWGTIKQSIEKTIGAHNYKNWIAPIEFSAVENDVAVLSVPTNFLGNYVAQNFSDLIVHQLSTVNDSIRRVRFTVAKSTPTAVVASARPAPAQPVSFAKSDDLPGAPLDPRFTFDTFIVGKPNELAHAAARRSQKRS